MEKERRFLRECLEKESTHQELGGPLEYEWMSCFPAYPPPRAEVGRPNCLPPTAPSPASAGTELHFPAPPGAAVAKVPWQRRLKWRQGRDRNGVGLHLPASGGGCGAGPQ